MSSSPLSSYECPLASSMGTRLIELSIEYFWKSRLWMVTISRYWRSTSVVSRCESLGSLAVSVSGLCRWDSRSSLLHTPLHLYSHSLFSILSWDFQSSAESRRSTDRTIVALRADLKNDSYNIPLDLTPFMALLTHFLALSVALISKKAVETPT